MRELRSSLIYTGWNLKMLARNPRTLLSALLAFLLCFLLTDKTVAVSREFLTNVQVLEPYIWCFADADSVFFASLVLLLLLSELPRLDPPAVYMLFRGGRTAWLMGQIFTVFAVCLIYTALLLASSMLMCVGVTFFANRWSDTATLLSFSPDAFEVALHVVRKTVKLTQPYPCAFSISALITLYTLFLGSLQLFVTIIKNKRAAVTTVLVMNILGYILSPDRLITWLGLDSGVQYYANLLSVWLSPLRHATYTMHNFGYDLLPRLWESYVLLGVLSLALLTASRFALTRRGTDLMGGIEYA